MASPDTEAALTILLVGGCVVTSTLIKWSLKRHRFPAVVGFMAFGILLRFTDVQWQWMTKSLQAAIGSLAWPIVGRTGAVLLAVSMVPRAEIAMIVMHQGIGLGDWAVGESALAMIIIVSAVTSLLSPIVLRPLLSRYTQRT